MQLFIREICPSVPVIDLRSEREYRNIRIASSSISNTIDTTDTSTTIANTSESILQRSRYPVNCSYNANNRNVEGNFGYDVSNQAGGEGGGITIVNIPFDSLDRRCIELPPRNVIFDVIYPDTTSASPSPPSDSSSESSSDSSTATLPPHSFALETITTEANVGSCSSVATHSISDGIDYLSYFSETVRRSTGTSQSPWRVRNTIVGSAAFFEEVKKVNPLLVKVVENCDVTPPLPRLWKPDVMVESLLLPLLLDRCATFHSNFTNQTKPFPSPFTSNASRTSPNSLKLSSSLPAGIIDDPKPLDCDYHNLHNPQLSDSSSSAAAATTTTSSSSSSSSSTSKHVTVKVMDLGSGAGRDVCFLAEEAMNFISTLNTGCCSSNSRNDSSIGGSSSSSSSSNDNDNSNSNSSNKSTINNTSSVSLSIIAVDFHKNASKRCLPLWSSRGVDRATILERVNLKRAEEFESLLLRHGGAVDFMYAVRFLNRNLLHRIASSPLGDDDDADDDNGCCNCDYVSIGGYFAISHFITEPDGSFPFDHPTISDVLRIGELEAIFGVTVYATATSNANIDVFACASSTLDNISSSSSSSSGKSSSTSGGSDNIASCGSRCSWRIIHNEISKDNDFGRSLIQFCVQKIPMLLLLPPP